MKLTFSRRELQDLLVAWVALGVAFAVFFAGGGGRAVETLLAQGVVLPLAVSMLTAGVGFLVHELAHKVVAIYYDQIAEFRAAYGMLFLAVMSAFLGFLFAAPGAVRHRGRVTDREHGIIALAGPTVNVALAVLFLPILVVGGLLEVGIVADIGGKGVAINLFLAAFNLVPIGVLDGATVKDWSGKVWVASFVPTAVLAFFVVVVLRVGF